MWAVLAQAVETLNRLGKNTDAPGTGTLFARARRTDENVGSNADAAGIQTLFARLRRVDEALVRQMEWNPTIALAICPDTWTTVVSVAGSGLAVVMMSSATTTSILGEARITVDGTLLSQQSGSGMAIGTTSGLSVYGAITPNLNARWGNWGSVSPSTPLPSTAWIPFKTSFLYQAMAGAGNSIRAAAVILS